MNMKLIGFLLFLIGSSWAFYASAEVFKPNILFIMADDLGKEWISSYGAEEISTPNIDHLAETGIRFQNAYSMPKCTPTRATLLTGQYPFRNGWINHWDVPRWGAGCHFDPREYTTFASVLKKAGYVTAIAGKWQINDFRVQPEILKEHGFDEYAVWTGFETGNEASAERYWDAYVHSAGKSKTHKGKFGPDVFTDFLIDFMGRHKDEPMMMYYPMVLPHGPFVHTPDEPEVVKKRDKHIAMTRYIDKIVGKLVQSLKELDIDRRTIVIFTTDNGTAGSIEGIMNGRKVKGGKGLLIESGSAAPFIVSCPGLVPEGVVTDTLTDFTDMLPTFAELGGAPVPENQVIDGRSIAKVILGKKKDSSRSWILSMGGGVAVLSENRVVPEKTYADRIIKDKRYKLWVIDGKPARFYDLVDDPGEKRNLINQSDIHIAASRSKLTAVYEALPQADSHPRYTPTPPQAWDITSEDMQSIR